MCGQVLCYQGKGSWRDPRAGVVWIAGVARRLERSGSCFRAGECRRLSANNEIGGELTVEAVLLNLSGATFLRRVLEVVPCDWASL